ncbi:bifunctional lysylphosphatidylglycerol flippase/synthetase MprF [Plantibacter sp. YIM 135249]|uniref:bifunctional lysylphosphatidylglycerol flippase/synthetase MprF n=1 Tax=Plantibacter sp. YIM 135249 TaxID=3423918 RepID=UPI003D33ED86
MRAEQPVQAEQPGHVDRTPGRIVRSTSAIGRYLASVPVAVGFAFVILTAALVSGTAFATATTLAVAQWGTGVETVFADGHWWTIFTALVIPEGPLRLVLLLAAVLGAVGWSERRLGHGRTALALGVTGVAGVGFGLVAQWLGNLIGEAWSAETWTDSTVDPLIPVVGALLTASAFAGPLWRRRVRIGGIAVLLVLALFNGASSDAYRLIAGLAGLLLGAALQHGGARFNLHRSSHAETRNLLALTVAISAIGPVIAALNPTGIGVLSMFGWIFGDPFPDSAGVKEACANESALACAHDSAFLQLHGPGSIILLFLPLALLLVAAMGLRKGRRLGLLLAVVVNLVIAALASVFAILALGVVFDPSSTGLRAIDAIELLLWAGGPMLVPVIVSIVLLVNRRHFAIRSDPSAVARFSVWTGVGFLLLTGLTLLASLLTISSFSPVVAPQQLLVDALLRFLPVNFLLTNDAVYSSTHPVTAMVLQWVGPVFWTLVVIGLVRVLGSSRSVASRLGETEVRRLIERGAGTLGFMALWPGNQYWFSADRQAAVAYRVIGDVAITLSDPICRPELEREAMLGFIAHCDANSWIPAFYSVHERLLPIVDELGWESLPVAVETTLDLTTLAFTGKSWQNIRTPLNRGTKEGISAQWTSYDELAKPLQTQIRDISEQWVTEKELPEMGFTLGGFEELQDPDVALMVAVGPDGRLQAVTSWLPVFRDGLTVGWTLDFMRKSPDSMPGIMEFLIASAALRMQADGAELLSLSGAPLATPPLADGEEQEAPTVLSRVLDVLARKLEPAYGFTSLFRYKAKFHPRYETLSLAYRDPLTLPVIGRAIGGAYLPELSRQETFALVRSLLSA